MADIYVGIPAIAIIGVIAGIALAPASERLHRVYFSDLEGEKHFDPRVTEIIRSKLTAAEQVSIEEKDALELTRAYYASRYNEGELYSFRISKSYGIMYYNLYLTCIVGGLSGIFIGVKFPFLGLSLVATCVLLAVSTRVGARRHFLSSLDQELLFWKGKSAAAVSEAFAAIKGLGSLR
ncbi:MAG TPA: hypothetical protein VF710_22470 [Longimicrobium sp.]